MKVRDLNLSLVLVCQLQMISNSRALQILLGVDMFALLAYNMAGENEA